MGGVMKRIPFYLQWKPSDTFCVIYCFHHVNMCNYCYAFYSKTYFLRHICFQQAMEK